MRRRIGGYGLLLLLVACPVWAQSPLTFEPHRKIELVSPLKAPQDAKRFASFWVKSGQSLDMVPTAGGLRCFVWAAPGRYVVTNLVVVEDKDGNWQPLQQEISFTVGTPPKPPPDDDDDDPVTIPDGHLGMTKWTYDTVIATVAKENRGDCDPLSRIYREVSADLGAVPPKFDIEGAANELRRRIANVFTTQARKDAWAVFNSRLQAKLQALGVLPRDDVVKVLSSIGEGHKHAYTTFQ